MKKSPKSFSCDRIKPRIKNNNLRKAINIFLGSACVILGFAYLVQINNLAVKGFALKELRVQASTLAEENEDLHARALSLQSYGTLSPRLRNLNMVAVEEIIYLNSDSLMVAKK
ncbi:MAG: hypothetical protein EOM88_00635 [Clostridia bacterium]|nr:hypothetical protein [Clostridia bacterium]